MKKETIRKQCKETREGNISRRDWLKGLLGGLGALAAGGSFYSCPPPPPPGPKPQLREFWKRVDQIKARALVNSAVSAARAQVGYSRSLGQSERADILMGKDAGKEMHTKSVEHFEARTEALRKVKTALADLAGRIDSKGQKRFTEFLNARGISSFTEDARKFAVRKLIPEVGIMPEDVKKAITRLDENLHSIERLSSFEDVVQFLDQHVDSLLEKKFGNPGMSSGLCILILLLSSIYIVLIMVAVLVYVLVCVLTLGLACQDLSLQEILDDMIADACGSE